MKEFKEATLRKIYSIEGSSGFYDRVTKRDADGDESCIQAHIGDSIAWFRPASVPMDDEVYHTDIGD